MVIRMNDIMLQTALFLQTAVQMGTPILLGTLGGILGEKVGNLNLGIEGMMLMGAVSGFQAGLLTGNPALAVLIAGIAGAAGALIYAVVTVTLRGNQVVTGLALTIFGTGYSAFSGNNFTGMSLPGSVTAPLKSFSIPVLSNIPIVGKMLFDQGFYIYFGIFAAIVIYIIFNKTRIGLNLRAVGENPAAADASGVNVIAYKYISILCGGFLCGVGGSFISIAFASRWQENITSGVGWIAVALIIFSVWNPLRAVLGAYLFGALRGIGFVLQNVNMGVFGMKINIPSQFLTILPYIITIVVLVFMSMRKRKESMPPQSLGNPYFREER